ncbi:MAG: diphthine--ammonia ligase [Thiomicrorhabdus sp.]|jgi:diphthine-ammonia ligase|nr:diphthine--ammonia ligase [Thiomicrorhabdus sp.]
MRTLTQPVDFYCSWSGGKDACLALYKMAQQGHKPQGVLTMMNEAGTLSRAHHLPKSLIEQQAQSLGLKSVTQATAKANYQNRYQSALQVCKQQGVDYIVLGDIDLQAHRDWQQQQGQIAQITPLFPLWQNEHKALIEQFIEAGFKATIIAILPDKVPHEFLGKVLNLETVAQLESLGIDVCAEGGEFHTVVTDGPLFSFPISLDVNSAKHCTNGEYGYDYLGFSL